MARIEEVEVIEMQPRGVLVKILKDNSQGLVLRREMSWDRSVHAPVPVFEKGQRLSALVTRDREGDRQAYLSFSRLKDPWKEATRAFAEGDVVSGEVVNLRSYGAFVQIEPGIDARVSPAEIPLLQNQLPEDVLSIGDRVQGVITKVDQRRRQIDLSLTRRLRDLTSLLLQLPKEREAVQLKLLSTRTSRTVDEVGQTDAIGADAPNPIYYPPIPKPERVLIVDDDRKARQRLLKHLKENFKFEADAVRSGAEAIAELGNGTSYGLIILDVWLHEEDSMEVAERILDLAPDMPLMFTSANPEAALENWRVRGRRVPFAANENDEVADCIFAWYTGNLQMPIEADSNGRIGTGGFVRDLDLTAIARRPLPELLTPMLESLWKQTGVTQCLVLDVDLHDKTVSIVAEYPPLDDQTRRYSLDGLYYSPVRNVIEEGDIFYRPNVYQDRDPEFRQFFRLLRYKCVWGIPLSVPDMITHHVLFLLDEQRNELDLQNIVDTRLAARFMQVPLERMLLLEYMRRYELRYSQGQLLGSMIHELRPKLDGLVGQIASLSTVLSDASETTDPKQHLAALTEAAEITKEIAYARSKMHELIRDYSRMVRGEFEAVDVHEVVEKVTRQLSKRADEAHVKIEVREEECLPTAHAIASRLEQVLSNLVMNAIQQIERQSRLMRRIKGERGADIAVCQDGLVIIRTRCDPTATPCSIQIAVIDTGPGVHYKDQERIFLLDTTTREEGQGLGLFISRNLMQVMKGQLDLTDSVIFTGSSFVIGLQAFSGNGEQR